MKRKFLTGMAKSGITTHSCTFLVEQTLEVLKKQYTDQKLELENMKKKNEELAFLYTKLSKVKLSLDGKDPN